MVVVNVKLTLVRFVQDQVLAGKSRDEKNLVDLDGSLGVLSIRGATPLDQVNIGIIWLLRRKTFCRVAQKGLIHAAFYGARSVLIYVRAHLLITASASMRLMSSIR